jgi:aromatic-L-amino-acid decarboxylase
MRADLLRRQIEEDRSAGDVPICVVAAVGTTATTSIDLVPDVADICEEYGIWLHVDAAYGGSAAILPEMAEIWTGVDRADSLVMNPHKWLFTQIDCSAFFSRRLDVVRDTFSLVPDYLKVPETDARNYMDYGVQLGRRFRALKLWFVIRYFGVEGIQTRIREHIRLARELASWIEADEAWRVVAPVPFSTVCFRYAPSGRSEEEADALNDQIMHQVNATGDVYLSSTKLAGRVVLRMAIGHIRTTEDHVRQAWDLLKEAAETCS